MTNEKKTGDETVVAPSLPIPLPTFEGIQPVGVVCKLNGAGSRIVRAMHYEERVVLVVEAEVSNVGHGKTGDGMKRIHTLSVKDLFELEGKPGATLIRSLRQAYKLSEDQRAGRTAFEGIGDVDPADGLELHVDESGAVLTTAELAERRGELLGLPVIDVAVLVFDDGTRALWPDDFAEATGPHPEAGESIRLPGAKEHDEPVVVRQVLDADTGETLEEWTDEQENERLRELEEAAARDEARADREAAEELERGRGRTVGDVGALEWALEVEKSSKNRGGMIVAIERRIREVPE
jgi:hypothetical protein